MSFSGECMNNVNKTLYIPLHGKAHVSKEGLFLEDRKAQEIWAAEGFPLKGKSASKWLAYYMGIRAAVFDDWVRARMAEEPEGMILHLGCGLDSRCQRVDAGKHLWYDVDFPEVIGERRRYFSESECYRMLPADLRDRDWLGGLPAGRTAIVVMEGVSMYLTHDELCGLMQALCGRFERVELLMDCYSELAAKLSRYKNPINDVGVTRVYGLDDPQTVAGDGLIFVQEHEMVPRAYVDELTGIRKRIFSKLYAGQFSKKLYRLYSFRKADTNF